MPETKTTEIRIDCMACEHPAAREAFEEKFYDVSLLLELLGEARKFEAAA
jgi:hypothetical protein